VIWLSRRGRGGRCGRQSLSGGNGWAIVYITFLSLALFVSIPQTASLVRVLLSDCMWSFEVQQRKGIPHPHSSKSFSELNGFHKVLIRISRGAATTGRKWFRLGSHSVGGLLRRGVVAVHRFPGFAADLC
jgi:hypothetical protein